MTEVSIESDPSNLPSSHMAAMISNNYLDEVGAL